MYLYVKISKETLKNPKTFKKFPFFKFKNAVVFFTIL